MNCTIFSNIFSKQPNYITIDHALERIKNGKSQKQVLEIRNTLDKEKAAKLKANLPSVCFSGTFKPDRQDIDLIEHSGFIVLDFDNVQDLDFQMTQIISKEFVYAAWISPSGNGLKALVKIADKTKHREHFEALRDVFPEADKSGINPSRVCYESFDENIYTYPDAVAFTTVKVIEKYTDYKVLEDEEKVFKNIVTWLTNRNDAFVQGERNVFIFKLASACCRFGINQNSAEQMIQRDYLVNSEFTQKEAERTIRSAYRANQHQFGTAEFKNEQLVEKTTRKEIKIDPAIYDETIRPKDVIYGIDVKDDAIDIWENGYAQVRGIGVKEFDYLYKMKKGEITLLSGIGNVGKSAMMKWNMLMHYVLYGEKFASFSPEDNPPEEYYHDFVEMLLGCDCTNQNPNRPPREVYEAAYDYISKGIFYLYPKDELPTPDYIKERFLELIIKEKISGVVIDPFNQLANDYGRSGRSDKYLETFLGGCSRFAQTNEIYFIIIAHPHKLTKQGDGNYPCPDVFDISDGAMWNNKMDNIIIYHRPYFTTDPTNNSVEFVSRKIKRQKTVGKRGFTLFDYDFRTRRYYFAGVDPMEGALVGANLDFGYTKHIRPQEVAKQNYMQWEAAKINEDADTELPF
jgi:hypothetical protein